MADLTTPTGTRRTHCACGEELTATGTCPADSVERAAIDSMWDGITSDAAQRYADESDVRAFSAEFPTPNTLRMVALAEDGTITWADAARVARRALTAVIADRDAR